jgi:membrane protease YdiL (CAAX protease family)
MFKFISYLILYIFCLFIDFFYGFRGICALSFDLLILTIIIATTNDTKPKIKFNYNNFFFFGIIACLLLTILSSLITNFLDPKLNESRFHIDLFFIFSITIKSFAEEFIFRGYWLEKMLSSFNPFLSTVITSFGFGVLHFFAGMDSIYAFACSIILCIVYIKTKSILTVYIVHMITNLFNMFLLPFIISLSVYSDNRLIGNIIFIIILLASIIKYFFCSNKKE